MKSADFKYQELDKSNQIIIFDGEGKVLDSDDTLVKVKGSDFNVFEDSMFCGMQESILQLTEGDDMSFDCVHIDFVGRTSHYDFIVKKLPDSSGQRFGWIVSDFGKQYEKIFELQQERNLAEIKAKKSDRETLRLKEERDAIEKLYQELQNNESSQYILLKSDNLLVNLDLNEVLYFEAYGDYIKVHTPTKMYVTYKTMKSVSDVLPENQFFRIHRSYIIRLDKIKNIEQLSVEINDKTLPIGKSYKAELIEKMGQL